MANVAKFQRLGFKSKFMIYCFLNISSFPECLDLHLKNLSWALNFAPYKVFVQTSDSFLFKKYENVKFITHPKTSGWIDYLNHMSDTLPKNGDTYLFLQCDNFFVCKIEKFIQNSIDKNCLILDYTSYYSFFINKKFIYPRVSEVGLVVPASILNNWVQENLAFGTTPNRFKKFDDLKLFDKFELLNQIEILCMENNEMRFEKLKYHVEKGRDTFFEPSVYSLFNNTPYEFWDKSSFIHWQKPETFDWKFPYLRNSPENLFLLAQENKNFYIQKYINNVALLFFLSGVFNSKNPFLQKCLLYHGPGLKNFIENFSLFQSTSDLWMDSTLCSKLNWVASLIKKYLI